MKKKALLYGLSAALLLVSLTACNKPQADQPTEPDPTPTPSAVQTKPPETLEPEETTSPVEPMAITLRTPTQEDLLGYFQLAHESGQLNTDSGSDWELKNLHIFFDVDPEFEEPADLDAQYLAWREANYPKEAVTPAPESGAPSSNPQTKPSTNNQAQPVSNQTGPGGATIVDDYGNPVSGGGDGSLETGGQRADFSQVKTNEDYGAKPADPSKIIYGGN